MDMLRAILDVELNHLPPTEDKVEDYKIAKKVYQKFLN
jgi:hypothetical protein